MQPWPRYSSLPFPAYRHLPGQTPHPHRDPRGHSYGRPEMRLPSFDAEAWSRNETYLHGVDLFNADYWWEAHEVLEALWHAAGHHSAAGRFLQGLILAAAAQLKRAGQSGLRGSTLAAKALARLEESPGIFMGVSASDLVAQLRSVFHSGQPTPIRIRLIGDATLSSPRPIRETPQ